MNVIWPWVHLLVLEFMVAEEVRNTAHLHLVFVG